MLVLSRKVGEVIQIGDDIVVTVVSVEGNKVRLGIQAPRSAAILRGELVNRMLEIPVGAGATVG